MKDAFPIYSIGHFINQPKSISEFEILVIQEMEEPEIEDPHKHNFYAIIWIDGGKGMQVIDYNEYVIKPKSLFFISPGQLHFFEDYKKFIGGAIIFTENFYQLNQQNKDKLFELSFLDNFYADPQLNLSKNNYKKIRNIIDLIISENDLNNSSDSIIQSLLNVLLLQIQRYIDSSAINPISKLYIIQYKKFRNLLENNYQDNLTVSDYAKLLNITRHHLNLICTKVTGKTASDIIKSRKILEAKRLLTFTENSVSEISTQLGYFDLSYFAKIFKIETGESPSAFKIKMSQKYRQK